MKVPWDFFLIFLFIFNRRIIALQYCVGFLPNLLPELTLICGTGSRRKRSSKIIFPQISPGMENSQAFLNMSAYGYLPSFIDLVQGLPSSEKFSRPLSPHFVPEICRTNVFMSSVYTPITATKISYPNVLVYLRFAL